MPPLPSPTHLQERRVVNRGLALHLRIWGDPEKPLVLLQHGGKDHGRSWDWTVAALLDSYCLAVPDLRGHGDSGWPAGGGYESFDFVADMAAVTDHLVEAGHAPPFHLVGHSLGGNIVLHYAAVEPDRVASVVSIEGIGFSQKTYDERMAKPFAERLREALERQRKVASSGPRIFRSQEEGVRRLAALHKQLSPAQAEHLALHALTPEEEGWRWKHDPFLGLMGIRPEPPDEYGPLYADIRAPTLVLYGEDSWATDPGSDGRIDVFRNARLETFTRAGHWLHHDRFDAFIGELRSFLGEHS